VHPLGGTSRPYRLIRRRLALAAVLCCLSIAIRAAPAAAVDLYFPADPSLDFKAASSRDIDSRFSPADGGRFWVGRKAPVAWLRFGLEGRSAGDDSPRIVEIRPSFSIVLDKVDLYVPLRGGAFKRFSAGALVPPQAGELRGRSFMFPLPRDALEGGRCYLRAESATDVEYRVYVRDEAEVLRRGTIESVAYGAIFGVLIAMALYNLFLFLSLGDIAYLFYVLYILMGTAWLFWVQGWARALLGGHPGLDQSLLWLFAGLMQACGSLFAASFLKLRGHRPLLFAVLSAAAGIAAATAAAGALGLYRLAFVVTNWLGAALCLFLVFAAILRLAQGFSPARYFLIGWSLLAAGGILFVLMNLQVLSVSFLTANSTALGMTAESILLSMALADRVRSLEREKLRLERSQERLRESSLEDALTGLYNRRFLSEKFATMVAKAKAEDRRLSVLLLDIDGFKGINDNWGHAFGDEILAALGRVIRSSIRDGDSPCRYGGEEFLVIMPDIALDDAVCVAERVRERFSADALRTRSGECVRATVSLGVTELSSGDSPQGLFDRADKAMYEAKRLGKNRVVTAGPGRA
jgi:diguanylate cyclase (GGDEF)-like protein